MEGSEDPYIYTWLTEGMLQSLLIRFGLAGVRPLTPEADDQPSKIRASIEDLQDNSTYVGIPLPALPVETRVRRLLSLLHSP